MSETGAMVQPRATPQHHAGAHHACTVTEPCLPRRTLLGAGLVLGLTTITGCTTTSPDWGPSPLNKIPRRPMSWAERRRLTAALKASLPDSIWVSFMSDSSTRLSTVESPFRRWWIADVLHHGTAHPIRGLIAVGPGRDARMLNGAEPVFAAVLAEDGYRPEDAGAAATLASLALDVTRDFRTLVYQVDSVDDILLLPKADRSSVARYRDTVRPPQAASAADGWRVTAFQVNNTDLVERTVTLPVSGAVSSTSRPIASDLPAPIGR